MTQHLNLEFFIISVHHDERINEFNDNSQQQDYSMIERTMKFRVNYYDTDQMGVVHHSNYVKYYETARLDLMRKLGLPYSEIEKTGIMLPVVDLNVRYFRPAFFDELLTIRTQIEKVTVARIVFNYKTYNEAEELLSEGSTTLAFISKETRQMSPPPDEILAILKGE